MMTGALMIMCKYIKEKHDRNRVYILAIIRIESSFCNFKGWQKR